MSVSNAIASYSKNLRLELSYGCNGSHGWGSFQIGSEKSLPWWCVLFLNSG